MPAYNNANPPTSVGPGDSLTLWNNETLVLGTASLQAALVRTKSEVGTPYKIKLIFSAAPGAIQFDVQEADGSDIPADYSVATNGSINGVDAGTGTTAIYEGTLNNARWIRIMPRTFANIATVKVTAYILR